MKVEFIKGVIGDDSIFTENLPWRIFVGRSNVGKSSLLNAIFERKKMAYTSKTPGKTTEINFYKVEDKLFIVDTPGYGYAKLSLKERQKMRDRLLWFLLEAPSPVSKKIYLLVDSKVGLTKLDSELFEILLAEGIYFSIVLTKKDKTTQKELNETLKNLNLFIEGQVANSNSLPEYKIVSAEKNFGIDSLREEIMNTD